jgi:hypothetical protein
MLSMEHVVISQDFSEPLTKVMAFWDMLSYISKRLNSYFQVDLPIYIELQKLDMKHIVANELLKASQKIKSLAWLKLYLMTFLIFEVLMTMMVTMKNTVFWDVTLCSVAEV